MADIEAQKNVNKKPKSKMTIFIVSLITIILLAVGGFLIYYFAFRDTNNKNITYETTNALLGSVEGKKNGKNMTLTADVFLDAEFLGWTKDSKDGDIICDTLEMTIPSKSKEKVVYYAVFRDVNTSPIEYEYQNRFPYTADVKSIKDPSAKIVIPSVVNHENAKYKIEHISQNAFKGSSTVESVSLPHTIIELPKYAFQNAIKLTSLHFSSGNIISIIPDYCFDGCASLESIRMTQNIKEIGSFAFRNTSLKNIEILSSIETIGNSAFANCSQLEKVSTLKDVKFLGKNIFDSCLKLKTVELPNGITNIPEGMFVSSGLTSINVYSSVKTIEKLAFASCKNLKSIKLYNTLIKIDSSAFASSGLQEIELPSKLNYIGEKAFYGCINLTKVTVTSKINYISENCFQGCTELSAFFAKFNTIQHIKANAFDGCVGLTGILLPSKLITLGNGAFARSGLKEITIPASVSTLGTNIFEGCKQLKKAVLSDDLKSIADGMFKDCDSLSIVSIPAMAEKLGKQAFKNTAITQIVIPQNISDISESAFEECKFLSNVVIDNNVATIGERAFRGCIALENITLPSSLTTIGAAAFRATGLATVTIPVKVKTINNEAFAYCDSLTGVVFAEGSEIQSIASSAFTSNSHLISIVVNSLNVPTIIAHSSYKIPGTATIKVPTTKVDEFKASESWKEYSSQIIAIA